MLVSDDETSPAPDRKDSGLDVRVSVLETLLPTLATKADISATKADISDVKAEIAKVHSDFGKWIVATVITLAFGMLAGIGSIVTLLRPVQVTASQQAAQPPIIIYNTPAPAQSQPSAQGTAVPDRKR